MSAAPPSGRCARADDRRGLSVALGAGGERAVAWEVGVLAGLADLGWDLRGADTILGTSAGALVAARLALGVDPRADASIHARRNPCVAPTRLPGSSFSVLGALWQAAEGSLTERRRALGAFAVAHARGDEDAFVARIGALVPTDAWPAALRVVAIDADTGERVVFGPDDGVPLARAVAASRAVPGLRPPVTIGGRRFIDGALGSATNADVLDGYAVVIVPLTSRPETAVEAVWLAALRAEVRDGLVIDADAGDVAAMGPDPMSGATAPLAVAAGRARAARVAAARVA
ncbi:patatin-like phospholipase family protein, partial [Solirubrobacter deserti]